MTKQKTIHELRSSAQAKGIKFSFSDDALQLAQKINAVGEALKPAPEVVPVIHVVRDGSTMAIRQEKARELLQYHVERGLHVTFPSEDTWHIKLANREDSGTLHMPPEVLLMAANRLLA